MNNKLTTLIIIALSMLTFVLAQDGDAPPALPGAGQQGTIDGFGTYDGSITHMRGDNTVKTWYYNNGSMTSEGNSTQAVGRLEF
jgi:hypothetical protein